VISKKMVDAINAQIQAELYSAYLYLSMSADCEAKNLKGFASWLKIQYQEETSHAMKLIAYLQERGGGVELRTIDAPPTCFKSHMEIFEQVLAHEKHVTALINTLYEQAVDAKDFATQIFLQWFVNEQVEEVATASAILERIKMLGDKGSAILYLDKELGKRGA
jgi:ferritin